MVGVGSVGSDADSVFCYPRLGKIKKIRVILLHEVYQRIHIVCLEKSKNYVLDQIYLKCSKLTGVNEIKCQSFCCS